MAHILLIRHGENDYTKTGRLAGWTDGVGLNDTGQAQATRLAERLADAPIKAIYSSPLQRCQETAAPLAAAKHLPITIEDGIGEVRYGKWQGQSLSTLRQDKLWWVVQNRPSAMVFPNGEAMRDTQNRAVAAIERLAAAHPHDMIAVFSHSDVIKMILAHYLGTPLDLFQRIAINTASVSAIQVSNGMPIVLSMNDTTGVFSAPPAPARPRRRFRAVRKANFKKTTS